MKRVTLYRIGLVVMVLGLITDRFFGIALIIGLALITPRLIEIAEEAEKEGER